MLVRLSGVSTKVADRRQALPYRNDRNIERDRGFQSIPAISSCWFGGVRRQDPIRSHLI